MDAGGYDENFKKWRYDDLPILPEPFRYVLAPGKEDTFENLRALMNRPDVDTIVNACDAGREGELIFWLVYEMAGCHKPVLRLWCPPRSARQSRSARPPRLRLLRRTENKRRSFPP